MRIQRLGKGPHNPLNIRKIKYPETVLKKLRQAGLDCRNSLINGEQVITVYND